MIFRITTNAGLKFAPLHIKSLAFARHFSVGCQPQSRAPQSDAPMEPQHELSVANLLPPAAVLLFISTIWSTYTFLHLIPQLQFGVPERYYDSEAAFHGWLETVISQGLTAMLLICYARAVLTSPGQVPEATEWSLGSTEDGRTRTREVKYSGERRRCKHCLVYKPDRCHHCRVCKCCILKMDHHCPWIMNCVGFRNHKFFFLLVIYAVLSCLFISTTVFASISRSIQQEVTMTRRFLLVLCLVTSTILGILLAAFLTFHTMLMLRGMTTIEFCEKATMASTGTKSSAYDLGRYQNIKAAFGKNPYLWLLPVMTVEGDGMCFEDKTCENASKQIPATESADPEWTGHRDSPPAPEKAHLMD